MVTRGWPTVFAIFLRLGCQSFGGPVAHLAYFRDEFVRRRRWLSEETFGQCVALTQFLPGPASSQTGMLVGWLHAGFPGALAAWAGFTLPSAALMAAIALLAPRDLPAGPVEGLLLVATAVVASAIVTMRATLAPDATRIAFALAALAIVLLLRAPFSAPLVIALGALGGALLLRDRAAPHESRLELGVSAKTGAIVLVAFGIVLAALALAARLWPSPAVELAATLFRVGSLVFGGGHVVLPLLQSQLVARGVVDNRTLLTGYAAAQAMPGPLFTIASFAGASAYGGALGWHGALLGTVAIFAPSFFLLAGVAPFYSALSHSEHFRAALAGANAAVVGLLGAALVSPIATSAIHSPLDALVAAAAFAALQFARVPAWALVIAGALAGASKLL